MTIQNITFAFSQVGAGGKLLLRGLILVKWMLFLIIRTSIKLAIDTDNTRLLILVKTEF